MANVHDEMLSAKRVADYFLAQGKEEEGDLVTNLKLQKLLYYAQGCHLALHDKLLFPEPIEAWNHGPVVPEIYHKYKTYGSAGLPCPSDFDFTKYSNGNTSFLDEVYSVYGQFSAWKLSQMTHEEPPWKEAFASRGVISQDAMKKFFKTQLVAEEN
jgi:uncharacterized phage-associated protein